MEEVSRYENTLKRAFMVLFIFCIFHTGAINNCYLFFFNTHTADELKSYLVAGYKDVERLIDQGTLNRTVASTNMNATSSRAHTIVVLGLVQKKVTKDGEVTTTSTINIVDLAGRFISFIRLKSMINSMMSI